MPLDLARKLANEGVMPNLAKLFKKSRWGELESSFPPLTAPAWAAFASGKNPGETGIFGFLQPEDDLNDLELVSSHSIAGKTFYEILEEKGKKCILVNLPCSYPSRIKKGIVISSFLAGDDFYYPKSLIKKVPELANYRLAPDLFIGVSLEKSLTDILDIEKTRFTCGKKLFLEDWDLFFYLVSATDWAMHLSFDKLIKGEKADPLVIEIFKKTDSYLGWFLDNLPKAAVLIMSDHGFTATSKVFYINSWLKKKGLLDLQISWQRGSVRGISEKMAISTRPKSFKRKLIRKIGLFVLNSSIFYSLLTRLIRGISLVFPDVFSDRFRTIGLEIDASKTKICALPGNAGWFGLYINDRKRFKSGIVSQKEHKKLKDKVYKDLSKVLGKESVWLKEEVYRGRFTEKGPDILFCPKDIFVSSAFSRRIFKAKKDNQHSRFGFLMLAGNGVKKARKIQGAKMTDLAPTIFHLLGVKKPAGMKGRVEIKKWKLD